MNETANFFDQIAEAQTPAPVKRKLARDLERAMAKRDAEKQFEDEGKQIKVYRAWKRAQRDALLAGPFGKEVRGIVAFLKTMTLSSAPALLRMIDGAAFVRRMSLKERGDLLSILNSGIAACRERAGLPPFDDEIPWVEPPKASTKLKIMMGLDGQ